MLQRAAQTLSTQDASRLVSDAARRASENAASKRPRGKRRHLDLVAVGLASVVAGTALKHRRDHEETISLLEAELARAKADIESAQFAMDRLRSALLDGASDAIVAIDGGASGKKAHIAERATALQHWMQEHIERALIMSKTPPNSDEDTSGHKPKII